MENIKLYVPFLSTGTKHKITLISDICYISTCTFCDVYCSVVLIVSVGKLFITEGSEVLTEQ